VTFSGWHSNKNNPLWVTLDQNNPLWVTFKHPRVSVCVYGPAKWRAGLYTPFFYVWTVIGGYRTRNEWMRMWQTYMTMKNPHYTSFFRHIQCEWSVSCTCDRTYRDTTPLKLLLKSARTAHPVLNACSTVFIFTNTVISKQVYTQVCASARWWCTAALLGVGQLQATLVSPVLLGAPGFLWQWWQISEERVV